MRKWQVTFSSSFKRQLYFWLRNFVLIYVPDVAELDSPDAGFCRFSAALFCLERDLCASCALASRKAASSASLCPPDKSILGTGPPPTAPSGLALSDWPPWTFANIVSKSIAVSNTHVQQRRWSGGKVTRCKWAIICGRYKRPNSSQERRKVRK